MSYKLKFFILCQLLASLNAVSNRTFPDYFLFGTATSAYQTEGAWDIDGKGEQIWDTLVHKHPEYIIDGTTGDFACESYYRYLEDIQMIKDLGVDYYRFSISWARILPKGIHGNVNLKGIEYYNKLIDALVDNNIQPVVTLYHFDLPQYLQDLGGLINSVVVKHFTYYAKIAFENFGDRVKFWLTFNEPRIICMYGYGSNGLAPAVDLKGIGEYQCAHNILKAHASVYHMYEQQFRSSQNGSISIVMNTRFYEAATEETVDVAAQEIAMQFAFGLYANPIFHDQGNYPQVVIDRVGNRSKAEGFSKSRLPTFTAAEIESIKGTYDFFALNHYKTDIIEYYYEDIGEPGWMKDAEIRIVGEKVSADAFRQLLRWIKERYNNPKIFISESGYGDSGAMDDQDRITFFQDNLNTVLEAIHDDNITIIGYTAWSLLDNFEWMFGYTLRFGLYAVDFESENKTRTARSSAGYYKDVVQKRCLLEEGSCVKNS